MTPFQTPHFMDFTATEAVSKGYKRCVQYRTMENGTKT